MPAPRRALLTLLRGAAACAAAVSTRSVRLYTPNQPLAADGALALTDAQRHYLNSVMRLKAGSQLLVFNGVDGEWSEM